MLDHCWSHKYLNKHFNTEVNPIIYQPYTKSLLSQIKRLNFIAIYIQHITDSLTINGNFNKLNQLK